MAVRVVGHCSAFATTVVTASGGIWNDFCWAMPFLIWPYLTAPIAVTNAAIATTIRANRFFMKTQPPTSSGGTGALVGKAERGSSGPR